MGNLMPFAILLVFLDGCLLMIVVFAEIIIFRSHQHHHHHHHRQQKTTAPLTIQVQVFGIHFAIPIFSQLSLVDSSLEDTTPLRAYLKPGEKKKQRMVPVIQLIDDSAPWQNVAVMQTAAISSFSVNSAIMKWKIHQFQSNKSWKDPIEE